MPPALTFTLIVAAELLLLFYLAIPYAWERFIAFGQARFDTHFGAYGDVPAVPNGLRAYEASAGAGEGIAAEARITDGSHCHERGL